VAHTHPAHVENCQGRRLTRVDDRNEAASYAHIYTSTATALCNA